MERKIRVGTVSYLNSKPLIFGMEQGMLKDEVQLLYDYPARIAAALVAGDIDLGLIPVAAIPRVKGAHIISRYGIGASQPVASVCLFSDVPLQEIQTILVDYQSRTSAALLQVLLREYWKITPALVQASEGYLNEIKGNVAGLVIGDRALRQRLVNPYIFDLAEAWQAHTGLPFLFAAWVANKELPASFIEKFEAANAVGFDHLQEIADANPFPDYSLMNYFTQNIDYKVDAHKLRGMELFLEKIKENVEPGR